MSSVGSRGLIRVEGGKHLALAKRTVLELVEI